ncbi:low affinity immunoglobulin gamma Fc region receptor III-A-like [Acridotheres tristis]
MPCPCPAVPSPVVALPGWCPLSPAGAQSTQLLVQPPWTPAVLWDRVTLTCQGSGTAGDTSWHRNGQRWWQEGRHSFRVTENGTYQCERPGTRLSPPATVSDDWLVLQVPAWALLEGDTVTLRCRGWWNDSVTWVSFYRDGNKVWTIGDGTELSLSPLQLHHSGRYLCGGWVGSWGFTESAQVTVTVQGPLSFSWHRGGSGTPLGTGPRLELRHVGDNDSDHYQCRVSNGDSVAESVPLNVTVLEEGEVLYTHVVITKQTGVSPCATTLQDPQVTYAELAATHGRPRECGDIYGNVL